MNTRIPGGNGFPSPATTAQQQPTPPEAADLLTQSKAEFRKLMGEFFLGSDSSDEDNIPDGVAADVTEKFLVLNHNTNTIEVCAEAPLDLVITHHTFNGVSLPIYHAENFSKLEVDGKLGTIWAHTALRLGINDMVHPQTGEVADKLLTQYPKDSTLFIAVGQSAKPVSWQLKDKGAAVISVNVSSINKNEAPTKDYQAYLQKKIGDKLNGRRSIVVMDYADSGASLRRVKADIKGLPKMDQVQVQTVALGTTQPHGLAGIDMVFSKSEFNELNEALHGQDLKLVMGRKKVKNDYKTWDAGKNKQFQENPLDYQLVKTLFKEGPQKNPMSSVQAQALADELQNR